MNDHVYDHLSREQLIERVQALEARLASLRSETTLHAVEQELRVHQVELEAQNQELREARHALEEARDRYSDLYDFAPVSYFTLDRAGVILELNLTAAQMLDLDRARAIGVPLALWVPQEALAALFRHLKRAFEAETRVFDDLAMLLPRGGERCHVRLESVPLRDAEGRVVACRTAIIDLSDRKRDEDRLALAAQVFEKSVDAILITDSDNRIVSVNRAFSEVTGYSAEEVRGKNPKLLASGRHEPEFFRNLWATLERDGVWSGEIWNRHRNGELYEEWLTIHAVRNERGGIENCIAIYTELSDQRAVASRIQFLAHYDPLTLLPNRALLNDRLAQALARATRNRKQAALLFLDLDRFKNINDSLGHLVGDRLLQQVSDRLRQCVRENDTVARRGGDEFVLVLQDIDAPEDAAHVADKIADAMAQSFEVDGHLLNITFSIGITLFPDDGHDAETLVKNADVAMYRAKESGRNTFQFFTPCMNAGAIERLSLENDLHRALERGEFAVVYQPQADGATGRIIGAEALLRWRHPTRGLVPPNEFIPVAEDSGLIVPIGQWVLREVCQQARLWREAGLPPIVLSVNISALQFRQKNLLALIADVLLETAAAPGCLELELTESVLMRDDTLTLDLVRGLDRLGVGLVIDDFGTGYSSLSYLRSFPIHKLKIDQSFVRELNETQASPIISAIIAMARNLNLKVLAEGVETEAQNAFLQAQQCDEIQGYLLSEPLNADDLAELLERVPPHWPPVGRQLTP